MAINTEVEQLRDLQKVDTVELCLHETEDSNPYPTWCHVNPLISDEQIKILAKTWTDIKSGESQGFRQFIFEGGISQKRSSQTKFSPRVSRNLSSIITPYSSAPSNQPPSPIEHQNTPNVWALRTFKFPGDDNKGDENKTAKEEVNTVANNLKISIEPQANGLLHQQNGSASLSPQINGRAHLTPKSNIDSLQFFYDTYIDQLKNYPILQIKSIIDMKTKLDNLLKLCAFLVDFSGKQGTQEYINSVKDIISEYNKHHINAIDHDFLGQAFLLSIKIVQGTQCSIEVLEAWKMAYSEFLRVGLQYVASPKPLYIKRRDSINEKSKNEPVIFSDKQKRLSGKMKDNPIPNKLHVSFDGEKSVNSSRLSSIVHYSKDQSLADTKDESPEDLEKSLIKQDIKDKKGQDEKSVIQPKESRRSIDRNSIDKGIANIKTNCKTNKTNNKATNKTTQIKPKRRWNCCPRI